MTVVVYILAAVVALFFLLQVAMIFKARSQRGKPAPELAGRYGAAGRGDRTALFYFHSPGCAACRPMAPIIKKLERDFPEIFEIDVTRDAETAARFGVMGTPATVLVRRGRIVEYLLGPQSEEKLTRLLGATS